MSDKVYAAIAAVMSDLAKSGIGKDQKNQQQGFKFRGIDDVYNALAPLLAKHGLVVLPRTIAKESTERQSKSGGVLFHTTLQIEFDFVCAEDGSKHTVGPIYGEAMDSGDKSISKAMSIAYKYAAFQAFCIPTEGDNDPDATTHALVDPKVAQYVNKVADVLNADYTEAQQCEKLHAIHKELGPQHDLYIAVADDLATKGIISKANWKSAVNKHIDSLKKAAA